MMNTFHNDLDASDLTLESSISLGVEEFGEQFSAIVEDILHAIAEKIQVSPTTTEFLLENAEESIAVEFLANYLAREQRSYLNR